ncbi:hypothetical protein [Curtobacterium caseinilyticum]|uniref:Uncharacterized protein n=1 Tax=Curtobacterium caseinilyticum TaxID=3055137 RepID=A0ABT7TRZ2_9MICO|nr:hypothetical protein [Curtobacterium caseinilyticum]MDM7892372.1 hypothetical protein [Curtobacterium caseinilyticum]
MNDQHSDTSPTDGSTDAPESEFQRTEDLPDGSSTGNATEDPQQDSDVDSGGEPASPENDQL